MDQKETIKKSRDARLRFNILRLLEAMRSIPWEEATGIRRAIDKAADTAKFDDDDHYLKLLFDLQDEGYIELQDTRTDRDQAYGVEYLNVRIKAKGVRFLAREEPADGMIDDGRIVKR